MITVRPERPEDTEAIHVVNRKAFGREVEAFMVLELHEGALEGRQGTLVYRPEFRNV